MTDWSAVVRDHLPQVADNPAREAEIVEELAQHLAQREADLVAGGADPDEARRRVLAEAPSWERLAEEIRRADRPRPMAPAPPAPGAGSPFVGLWHDLRYAARTLRRAPGYTSAVVVILTVAIGATTATFSVVNGVLLSPLPYDEPGRLVRVYDRSDRTSGYVDGPTLTAVRQTTRSFASVAGVYTYRRTGADLAGQGAARRVSVYSVTAGYFETLRVGPLAGRTFAAADERPDANVALVGEELARQLCSDPSECVGRSVVLDGVPARIVGVMPRRFRDPIGELVEVWTPHVTKTAVHDHYVSVVARLSPQASIEGANAELGTMVSSLNREYNGAYANGRVVAVPLHEDTVGHLQPILLVLTGAVGLVLLIACVNLAHLVLARGLSRERELAIRAAVGCGRWRLVRQVLTELAVLGVIGGAAGALLAWVLVRVLLALAPATLARPEAIVLDGPALLVCAATALGAVLLSGLPAGFRVPGGDIERLLRSGSRGTSPARRRVVSAGLVTAQVALSVVVLSAAVLLVRTFTRLSWTELGFSDTRVLTFEVNLPTARYPDGETRARLREQLSERLDSIPGVAASGRISRLPASGEFNVWTFRIYGRSDAALGDWMEANVRTVDGRYFETLAIPLARGRLFDRSDRAGRPGAMLVSETMARTYFPGEDPIGRRIRVAGADWSVVGIVSDVRHDHRLAPAPTLYLPHAQMAGERNWGMTEVVRLGRPRPDILAAIREALAALDPELVLHRVQPLEDVVAEDLAAPRFSSTLMTGFAGVGLLLAALGLVGVLSYSVSERTQEIGVRMALGATRADVRHMVVGAGLRWVVVGLALGLPAAVGAWRALGRVVVDADPLDVATLAVAAALMLVVAVMAAAVPARRATRVEPLRALRSE